MNRLQYLREEYNRIYNELNSLQRYIQTGNVNPNDFEIRKRIDYLNNTLFQIDAEMRSYNNSMNSYYGNRNYNQNNNYYTNDNYGYNNQQTIPTINNTGGSIVPERFTNVTHSNRNLDTEPSKPIVDTNYKTEVVKSNNELTEDLLMIKEDLMFSKKYIDGYGIIEPDIINLLASLKESNHSELSKITDLKSLLEVRDNITYELDNNTDIDYEMFSKIRNTLNHVINSLEVMLNRIILIYTGKKASRKVLINKLSVKTLEDLMKMEFSCKYVTKSMLSMFDDIVVDLFTNKVNKNKLSTVVYDFSKNKEEKNIIYNMEFDFIRLTKNNNCKNTFNAFYNLLNSINAQSLIFKVVSRYTTNTYIALMDHSDIALIKL